MTRLRQTKQSPRPEAVAAEEARTAESTRSELTTLPHFTPAERAARGKAARGEIPRSSHGAWEPAPNRRDPVDLLEEQAQDTPSGARPDPLWTHARLSVRLLSRRRVPDGCGSRRRRADGSARPALRRRTPLELRRLRGSRPEARLHINDFDETLPGPFEWDVKRLAASFAVAGRDRGFDGAMRRVGGHGHCGRVPGSDGAVRGDAQPRGLVHAPRRRGQLARFSARRLAKQMKRSRRTSPRSTRRTACAR